MVFKETTLFQLVVFRLTWGESPGQDTAFPLPLLFVCEEEEKERRGGQEIGRRRRRSCKDFL